MKAKHHYLKKLKQLQKKFIELMKLLQILKLEINLKVLKNLVTENYLYVLQKLNIVFQLILTLKEHQQIMHYQLEKLDFHLELSL